jgi:hypothetical protein
MIEDVQKTTLPKLFVFETCQLHLRLACECLAIGCLAAQGDFKTHKAFTDEYRPPVIFKALEERYPDFFPGPSRLAQMSDGSWHFDGNDQRPAITRAEVEKVWNVSGSHMHRANLKRYVKRTNSTDFKAINDTVLAFWYLIADHSITLAPTEGAAKSTIFHVMIDRLSDAMKLQFYEIDKATGSVQVDEFPVAMS